MSDAITKETTEKLRRLFPFARVYLTDPEISDIWDSVARDELRMTGKVTIPPPWVPVTAAVPPHDAPIKDATRASVVTLYNAAIAQFGEPIANRIWETVSHSLSTKLTEAEGEEIAQRLIDAIEEHKRTGKVTTPKPWVLGQNHDAETELAVYVLVIKSRDGRYIARGGKDHIGGRPLTYANAADAAAYAIDNGLNAIVKPISELSLWLKQDYERGEV